MTTDTLRVRFEDETDPTFPDSWGWDASETAEYMAKVEDGDYVVVMASVEHLCPTCDEWHDAGEYLGDIHIGWDDLYPLDRNGALRLVTESDIPYGPTWWGPERATPSNAATSWTPSPNYLLQVAADLMSTVRPA